jgi:L-alanine-DL-glutamate epimerase-like enolase superfamily enzyme
MSDRVRELRAAHAVVPLPEPLRLGQMTVTRREYAAVEVVTDDGLVGRAYCLTREAPMAALVARMIRPHVVDNRLETPDDVQAIWRGAFRATAIVGRVGLLIRALGLVDVALWDVAAKRAGLPLWELLARLDGIAPGVAGAPKEAMLVAAYGTPGRTADDLADELLDHARRGGWPLLKVARSPDVALMRALIARCAAALPTGQRLVVDAGFGWPDADTALAEIAAWEAPREALAWLEDPLLPEDADGTTRIRADGPFAVGAGDEVTDPRTNAALLRSHAVDVLRLDAIAIGGVTPARRELARAADAAVPVSCHVYPEISVHLPGVGVETFDREPPHGNRYDPAPLLIAGGPTFADGRAAPPRAPGLGFDLDWERFGAWV